jgi:N-methylhydantoinase A
LGRLNPEYFLGGEIKLDAESAKKAIERKIAEPVGLNVNRASFGIVKIAEANMANAMRISSVQRGYDPRDFCVVAYGGAGPMVAGALSREIGCHKIIVPQHPGIFSAIGMLSCDVRFDYIQSCFMRMKKIDLNKVNRIYRMHEMQGIEEELGDEIAVIRSADMRFVGQNYEVTVGIPGGFLIENDLETITFNFFREHSKLYGHFVLDEPIELVNLRTTILSRTKKPILEPLKMSNRKEEKKGERAVYFEEYEGFRKCSIYERLRLNKGTLIEGPAIIEGIDSTTVVNPCQMAEIDSYGNIVITES